ncbi:DNA-binding transcriptional regulator, XRE-family HTH domain [Chitinophaga eiseniae]|uniref:DNA-binding transcriptional regulator, XRE-family HTH domain n=1 Tax=Chitinophaga eiseniae TaxID=634771 RepID=A0A1T4SPK2_9BACT|nr:helix-turn-helix transcriptional regulator [Chitinophaga eiseniae]SKA30086.1 DNA-binding transcriptional regulator, XRE-family HTH domain [Chitinophaga eiseniae]
MKEIFAENMKYLRKLSGLDQGDFADFLKVHRFNIGSYEQGRCYPSVPVILRICRNFSVSIEDLLTKNLEDKCKRPAPNAKNPSPPENLLKIQAIREAANLIANNAQMLLSESDPEG